MKKLAQLLVFLYEFGVALALLGMIYNPTVMEYAFVLVLGSYFINVLVRFGLMVKSMEVEERYFSSIRLIPSVVTIILLFSGWFASSVVHKLLPTEPTLNIIVIAVSLAGIVAASVIYITYKEVSLKSDEVGLWTA